MAYGPLNQYLQQVRVISSFVHSMSVMRLIFIQVERAIQECDGAYLAVSTDVHVIEVYNNIIDACSVSVTENSHILCVCLNILVWRGRPSPDYEYPWVLLQMSSRPTCMLSVSLQELVSFRHPHVQNPRLQDDYESKCQMYLESPYDEMVAAHIGYNTLYVNNNMCLQI